MTWRSSAATVPPRQHQHRLVADRHGLARRRRGWPVGRRRRRPRTRPAAGPVPGEHAHRLQSPNVSRRCSTRVVSGSSSAPAAASRARVSASALRPVGLARPPPDQRHERRDHQTHEDEHGERDDVVAVVDGPRVQRREEEPVGVQRRADRGDERRASPADRGDAHHHQEVQQQHRRELERVALRGQHAGQRQRRQDREHPTEQHDGAAEATSARLRGTSARRPFGSRGADDVHVDRTRSTEHAVDHRPAGQLGQARPAGGTEDELGGPL